MSCPFYKEIQSKKTDAERNIDVCEVVCNGNLRRVEVYKGFELKCDWINYCACDEYKRQSGYCPHFNGTESYMTENKAIICCELGHTKHWFGYDFDAIYEKCTGNYSECEKYKEDKMENTENYELQLGGETDAASFIDDEDVKALAIDTRIREHTSAIGEHFVALAQNLKEMRDSKLYTALGYESFDSYVENSGHPFKVRQAYSYISVYESYSKEFLQSNANLGVTKLEMLKSIFPSDRDEFIAENDVEDMSTRELKDALDKIKEQGEQMSLLSAENDKLRAEKEETQLPAETIAEISELKKKIDSLKSVNEDYERNMEKQCDERMKLQSELDELKKKPVEVAVSEPTAEQIQKIRDEIAAEVDKIANKRIKKVESELKKLKDENTLLSASAGEADALKKKLAAAQNDEVKEFKIYFEDTKSRLEHLFSVLGSIKDEETKKKLTAGTLAFLDAIKEDLR